MDLTVGQMVRSTSDGQLGHLVETSAGTAVKLDRGTVDVIVAYDPGKWIPADRPKLTSIQIGQVMHEADRALQRALGMYGSKEWLGLPEKTRIAYSALGPDTKDTMRRALFKAIRAAIS